MGIANKYNSTNITWTVDTEGLGYIKASELEQGKEYDFNGCFKTKDHGFGEGCCIISNVDGKDILVSAPQSFTETVDEIRSDAEAVEAIRAGKLRFKVESFMSKYKRTGYKIVLVDVE